MNEVQKGLKESTQKEKEPYEVLKRTEPGRIKSLRKRLKKKHSEQTKELNMTSKKRDPEGKAVTQTSGVFVK